VALSERYFIKAVAEMVTSRSAALIAASYAGFLRRMDPQRQHNHVIGINGSLYEKMPGFAAGIQAAMVKQGGWNPGQVSFFNVSEAPLVGAAIAAAMAKEVGAL
jgi:hexokinase